ncbi:hypothetical protein [Peribacillus muralis]|nr:hypothetical protein [Peribacillus muralis]
MDTHQTFAAVYNGGLVRIWLHHRIMGMDEPVISVNANLKID